ncbi:MAG: flagellar biosynthetic protein FliO [Desulfobacterales bacterium]|nr:flagellar biosynthetic protein FliO [Desulfobacterales bacterium]
MSPTPLVTDGLRMIGILVFIVGGLLFLNYFIRRQMHAGGRLAGRRRISVLENAHLGVKKSIALVQVPGAVLVLGVTNDRITLLERIAETDEAWKAVCLPPGEANAPRSFKDHLRQLTTPLSGRAASGRGSRSE